jgi:hypothetical protein
MKTYDIANKNEYYADHTIAVNCVEIQLKDTLGANQTLYLCDGGFNVTFTSPTAPNGTSNEYIAQGNFIGFSGFSEDLEIKVGKFSIVLSAIGNDYISKILNYDVEGSRVVIYKCFMNFGNDGTQPLALVASPIMLYDGAIFNFAVNETAKSCQLVFDCSSIFADYERTAGRKTNNWSNWLYQGYKDDLCMDKAGWVGETEIKWGRA